MVRWVDEIRADLEWLDFQSPCGKCCHDAACNGCLTTPAVRPSDNDAGNADHDRHLFFPSGLSGTGSSGCTEMVIPLSCP